MTMISRWRKPCQQASPDRSPEPNKTLYSFAVIIEPLIEGKEKQSLKAYFSAYPFPFEIEEWVSDPPQFPPFDGGKRGALSVVGGNYKVADSFKLEEIEI